MTFRMGGDQALRPNIPGWRPPTEPKPGPGRTGRRMSDDGGMSRDFLLVNDSSVDATEKERVHHLSELMPVKMVCEDTIAKPSRDMSVRITPVYKL